MSFEEYMNSMVQYEIHSSRCWMAFGIVLAALSVVLIGLLIKYRNKIDDSFADGTVIFALGIVITVFIAAVVVILVEIDDINLATYFPQKLYIRYLRHAMENF